MNLNSWTGNSNEQTPLPNPVTTATTPLVQITPLPPNNAPTAITLTPYPASVNQSGGINAVVGTLSTTDADAGDTHTYSMVAGLGDTYNPLFHLQNNGGIWTLRANDAAALVPATYSVRIQTMDQQFGTFSQSFSITVVDDVVPAPPHNLLVNASGSAVSGNGEGGASVMVRNSANQIVGSGTVLANGSFSVTLSPAQIDGGTLSVTLTDADLNTSVAGSVSTPDLTAPTVPVNLQVNADGTALYGTGEVGSTVTVHNTANQLVGTGTVQPDGSFAVSLSPAQDDGGMLYVNLTDAAGNISVAGSVSAPDNIAPAAPENLQVNASGTLLSGTGEAGSTATVRNTYNQIVGTATVQPDGSFTVVLSPAQDDGSTLSVTLTDAAGNTSVAGTVTAIAANYPPSVTSSGGASTFTESVAGDPEPVVIDPALTVSDPDNETLASATVQITGNFQSAQDILAFVSDATFGNIIGNYDPNTGTLTLSSAGGTATLAQWQGALQSVTYSNLSQTPSTATRTISFTINDGMDNSNPATKEVTIIATNNAPIISNLDGDNVSFTEKGPAVLLDAGGDATVSDVDNADLNGGSLTVSVIANGIGTEDVLGIRNEGLNNGKIGIWQSNVVYEGDVIGTFAGGTGSADLVISFTSTQVTQVTHAAVQALIRNLTYANSHAGNPSTAPRTVRITLTDGDGATSLPSEVTVNIIAVNDGPSLVMSSPVTTFTEVLGDTPLPIAVDNGITVSDPDSETLAWATVSIVANYYSNQDILAFTNSSSMGDVNGSFDEATGVLALTSASGTATLAQWQAALRAVNYSNTSKAPETVSRGVSFVAHDGSDSSNLVFRQIQIIDVNDPPTIDAPASIEVVENVSTALTGISFDDPDAGNNPVTATFSIPLGRGVLQANAAVGVDVTVAGSHTLVLEGALSAINDYLASGELRFTNTPDDLGDVALDITITDNGHTGSGPAQLANETLTITVRATVPRVERVYSPDADGLYGAGSVITMHVEFDREVIATEAGDGIRLLVDTGVPGRFASYASGSGSETLVFEYTVQEGDEAIGLDYVNTTALTLSSSSTLVSVAAAVGANLTLPVPGDATSLSGSSQLIVDGIKPTVNTRNITLELDANGAAVLLPSAVDDGSNDNLTHADDLQFAVSQTNFDCEDIGPVQVTLTVTDEAGNEGTATATVTVVDLTAPVMQVRNLLLALDASGQATVTANMIDNGTTDACGIATLVLSKTVFDRDDLGANTVTLTATDNNGNENTGTATVLVVAFNDASFVYDETVRSLLLEGTLPTGVTVSYTNNGQTEAGTYTVTANIDGGADFNDLTLTAELEITQASLVGVITLEDDSFVYNGTPRSLAITGTLPAGVTVSYVGNAQTEAGTHTVTANINGGNNYENLMLTATLEITKASLVGVITLENDSFVYNGTPRSLAITGTLPAGVTVNYMGNAQTEAGTHTVTANINGGNNYEDLTLTAELEITQASLAGIITMEDDSFVYNGTPRSLAISGTLPAGVTVNYVGNVQTEAGTHPVTANINGGNNYENLTLTATLTINKAEITGISLGNQSFVYDGQAKSLTISGTLPQGASVSYLNNSRTDAGIQTVTANINGGNNYNNSTLTATLTITQATRTLNFPAIANKTFGDAAFAAGATASTGETVRYSSSNTAVATVAANGQISIVGAGQVTITATLTDNTNYTSNPVATRSFTVAKAAQTISHNIPAQLQRNAGNVPLTVSASSGLPVVLQLDDELVATLSGSNLNVLRIGTVRITLTQEGNDNYLPAAPITVTVRVVDPTADFDVIVHPAVSPNGDGVNDFLIIEGIRDYTDNKVTIFTKNGTLVYEVRGYNNGSVAFGGIGTGGNRLPAGTYYYIVEVNVNGQWKHKKGFFVLRY